LISGGNHANSRTITTNPNPASRPRGSDNDTPRASRTIPLVRDNHHGRIVSQSPAKIRAFTKPFPANLTRAVASRLPTRTDNRLWRLWGWSHTGDEWTVNFRIGRVAGTLPGRSAVADATGSRTGPAKRFRNHLRRPHTTRRTN
jgi:hypothetical protein